MPIVNLLSPVPELRLPTRMPTSEKFTFDFARKSFTPRRLVASGLLPRQTPASVRSAARVRIPHVYLVDDEPHLTELYTMTLESKGCFVRAFSDRAQALAALKQEEQKPDLLVIDYLGDSMLTDRFMNQCLEICPNLRILMASGLSRGDMRFSSMEPDRFLQKPFTPEEFLGEVSAVLAPDPGL